MKSIVSKEWQCYEQLIKTVLLGLGTMLFINSYLYLKLPVILIVVEVLLIGTIIDGVNSYKKYIQTYLLLGASIGIFIAVFAYFHINIADSFYESFKWLKQYDAVEERYVFYKAFCVSLVFAMGSILSLYLLQKSMRLQSGLSVIVLIGVVYLTISKVAVGKAVVFFMLSYMAWVFIQVSSYWYQRKNAQYNRKMSTFLLPFALLIGIGAILGPTSKKPISWQFVIKTVQQVADSMSEWGASIEAFTTGDNGEFQIQFSDEEYVELDKKLGTSEQLLLTVEILPLAENKRLKQIYEALGYELKQTPVPKNITYLKGNVRNVYTGHGWSKEQVYEVEDEEEYQLEYKELLYSLYRSQLNTIEELFHPASIAINFEKLRTKSLFYTNATYDLVLNMEEKPPFTKGVNITYKRNKKKGFNYHFSFIEMNLESEVLKNYLRSLDDFRYEENPTNQLIGSAHLQSDAVFWQVYQQEGLYSFLTGKQLEKQLYERAQHINKEYTSLPKQLPARVYELAQSITKDAPTTYDKLEAIKQYLKQYTYTKTPQGTPEEADFVDYFLFQQKEGYCTYFATAMAVLARCEGIPTRYVEGIVVDYSEGVNGVYPVMKNKLHAWVEAYIEGYGWVTFDATSQYNNEGLEGWNKVLSETGTSSGIIESTMPEEVPVATPSAMKEVVKEENSASKVILWILGTALVILPLLLLSYVGIVAWKYKRQLMKAISNEKAKLLIREILFYIEKRGYPKLEEESIMGYAKRVDQSLALNEVSFEEVINIYLKCRFGEHQVTIDEMQRLDMYLAHLKLLLSRELGSFGYRRLNMYFLLVK